ncbi:MAG: GNAT family N-acetyltransferase [Calditrichia bacterium]
MIRPASRTDALSVAAIQLCSSQAAYGESTSYLTIERMEHRLKVWSESIAREGVWIDLFELEQVPVAYVSYQNFYPQPETGEITSVFVLPSYWSKGIGKQLMQHAETILGNNSVKRIALWVLESNLPTIAFYKKLGYTKTGNKKPFGEADFSIEMSRTLT